MNASGRSAFSTLTVLVVIGTLLLGILACNLGGSSDIAETEEVSEPGGGPETQPLLKPTSAPEGTSPTEAPASVELEIVNESSEAICFVYIAPSASESWGVDQLGGETIIAPGDSFSIDEIPPGSYDLLAQDCDEQTLVESSAEVFEDDLYTWTIFDQTPGGDTMLVTDDYNSIQMEVPTSWNDLNGEPWYDGGDVIGA